MHNEAIVSDCFSLPQLSSGRGASELCADLSEILQAQFASVHLTSSVRQILKTPAGESLNPSQVLYADGLEDALRTLEETRRDSHWKTLLFHDAIEEGELHRAFQVLYFLMRAENFLILPLPFIENAGEREPSTEMLKVAREAGFILEVFVAPHLLEDLLPFFTRLKIPCTPSPLVHEETECVVLGRKGVRTSRVFRHLKRPEAVIFNNFFRTSGGGERSSLDVATALDRLGFAITLATDHKVSMTLEEIVEPFGIDTNSSWKLREFNGEGELLHYVRQPPVEVFVNHTYGSGLPNLAPVGIYSVMFPFEVGGATLGNLLTYDHVVCNSRFTEKYVKRLWSRNISTSVLYPPILEIHTSKEAVAFSEKEKLVLNIGRFNVNGHNKCQLDAVRAFTTLVDEGVLDREWRLVVAGKLNQGKENERYLEQCRIDGRGYNVEVLTNVSIATLTDLYRRASYLWQFTAYGSPFGYRPEYCEHLGLVALDCFAYGTIPVAYHRSGITYVIKHGMNGYTFADLDELRAIMNNANRVFGTVYHQKQFENSLSSSAGFSFNSFKDTLEDVLRRQRFYAL